MDAWVTDRGDSHSDEQAEKRRRRLLLLLLLLLLLMLSICVIAFLGWREPRARRGHYEGKTPDEIQGDLDSSVEWYAMEISVASAITMAEGDVWAEARIENVAANHCDQKVRMYPSDDPHDVLYESGGIAPGEYVQFVELAHPLSVGRHAITVEFQGYEQTPTFVSDEGQLLGHDRFGASCAAEITIDVLPAHAEQR